MWNNKIIFKMLLVAALFMLSTVNRGVCGPPFLFLGDSSVPETIQAGKPLDIPVFLGSGLEASGQLGEVLLGFMVTDGNSTNATGEAYCLDVTSSNGWVPVGDRFEDLGTCRPISGVQFPHHLYVEWRALNSVYFKPGSKVIWLACADSVIDGHVEIGFVEGDDTFCTTYEVRVVPSCDDFTLLFDGEASASVEFDDVSVDSGFYSKTISYTFADPTVADSAKITIKSRPDWVRVTLGDGYITFSLNTNYMSTSSSSLVGQVQLELESDYCKSTVEIPVTVRFQQNTDTQTTLFQQSSTSRSSSIDFFALLGVNQTSSKLYVYQSATATMPDNYVSETIEQGQVKDVYIYVKDENGNYVSTLSYSDDSSWLSVSKVTTGKLRLRIDGARLSQGQSATGHVSLKDTSTGATASVTVSVSVTGVCDPETAQVANVSDVNFELQEGGSTSSKLVRIKDTCGNDLTIQDISVSPSVKWLDWSIGSTSITFTATPSDLSGGYTDSVSVTVYTEKGDVSFKVNISITAQVTYTTTSSGTIRNITPIFKQTSTGAYSYVAYDVEIRPGSGILYSFTASVPDSSHGIRVTLQPNSIAAGGSGDANAYIKIGSAPTVSEVLSNASTLISNPSDGTIVEEVTYNKVMDESKVYVLIYNPGTNSDNIKIVQITHY